MITIPVPGREETLAADVVCRDIVSALELLLHPLRRTATLRT